MRLTKKFWTWISQVLALVVLFYRADVVFQLFKIIPYADASQLYPKIALFAPIVIFWALWLVWRGIKGFSGEMDFLFDTNDRRRW